MFYKATDKGQEFSCNTATPNYVPLFVEKNMIPVYTFLEDAVLSLRNTETVWKTSLIFK